MTYLYKIIKSECACNIYDEDNELLIALTTLKVAQICRNQPQMEKLLKTQLKEPV